MPDVKHTPGPWTMVEPVAIDYRAPIVFGRGTSSRVATMDGGGPDWAISSPEARANAHLIAAAPDLLEALKEAADMYRDFDRAEIVEIFGLRDAEFAEKARAAICKAEGVSSKAEAQGAA